MPSPSEASKPVRPGKQRKSVACGSAREDDTAMPGWPCADIMRCSRCPSAIGTGRTNTSGLRATTTSTPKLLGDSLPESRPELAD
jgi:hypothetical protein